MTDSPSSSDYSASNEGFSLIEVLVALTILAIAGASFIRVGEHHINAAERLETRMFANLVANNRLAELRVEGGAAGRSQSTTEMGGRMWRVEVQPTATADADLTEFDISVFLKDQRRPVQSITGFVDTGAAR